MTTQRKAGGPSNATTVEKKTCPAEFRKPIPFVLPINHRFRLSADECCWRIEQRRKAIDLVGDALQLTGSEPHKIEENGAQYRFPTPSRVSDDARRQVLNTAGVRCAQPLIGLKTPTKAGKFLPLSAEGGSHFAECFDRQPKQLKPDYALP